jgi:glycogen phosphorylase
MQYSARHPIAYFCAEYGLDARLPIYAGGLGILAGDTLKAAADAQLPMVGIGLLYRGEAAAQRITPDGQQEELDVPFDPLTVGLEHVYQDDQPVFIQVHLTQLNIWVRVWKKTVSETVTLYLLDTDTDQNQLSERSISHELYAGTPESLLKQQLILGIAGVKLLYTLGIHPAIYHINEGRPAFLHWQLVRVFMDQHGMSYKEAVMEAKARTVYTNHTLVAAGNPGIPVGLLKLYAQYYSDKMKITVDELIQPGMEDDPETFMVTRFALNVSRRASGVSQLHTQLSRKQWPDYSWENVTNGVHQTTWQHPAIAQLGLSYDHSQLWQAHQVAKHDTASFIQARTGYGYDPNRLVIGWARRIAGYKHVEHLFTDLERLTALVKSLDRPVQILIAGKAHRLDSAGKIILQEIIQTMQGPLAGHALFIPNYDLDVARALVQGCDLWLNTPEYGMEASGTSGMKAIANGVVQCTIADGWAHEVDWTGKGWVLDHLSMPESLYTTLEKHVVPAFFERNQGGIPEKWLELMRASLALYPQFSAARMVNEYQSKLYSL